MKRSNSQVNNTKEFGLQQIYAVNTGKVKLPVINELGKWIFAEVKSTSPNSQISKAMRYAMDRWDKLSAYLLDGSLHIDNNAIENTFARSHWAAKIISLPEHIMPHQGRYDVFLFRHLHKV